MQVQKSLYLLFLKKLVSANERRTKQIVKNNQRRLTQQNLPNNLAKKQVKTVHCASIVSILASSNLSIRFIRCFLSGRTKNNYKIISGRTITRLYKFLSGRTDKIGSSNMHSNN